MKICDLKIKDSTSLGDIVHALTINGYTVQTAVMWKEFPQTGIDYFIIGVWENTTEKGGAE